MNTKLGRAKQAGPKAILEERDYNWTRVATIVLAEPFTPTQVDIWWARKFLRFILCNPMVKRGRSEVDETEAAQRLLKVMDRRWPDRDKPRKKKVVLKVKTPKKNPVFIKAVRRTLWRVQKDIRELKPKSDYWERRLARTPMVKAKEWLGTWDKTLELRKQIAVLQSQAERLKTKL